MDPGLRRDDGKNSVRGRWKLRLSPRHARQEVDLAAFGDRAEPVVAVDLAVDRHRHAAVDQRLQLGMVLAEAGQQLVDVGRLDRNAGPAAGGRLERPRQLDLDHRRSPAAYFASIAASRRGGDIGICISRMPAALETALATAASGGTIEVAPTPRTP